ncbi:MAG: hypothetical protein JRH20_24515, partial [Deltaproteobacteria bacterium]|nr:hypothetical protein [Deltaproteobacteria bacterium]
CNEVIGVMDEDTLRGTCFAELGQRDCAQVNAFFFPASCLGRLIYDP